MVYEDEKIRERIVELMRRENLTQLEFAKRINRNQPGVSDIMNGRRNVSKGFVSDIINAFPKVRKDWLLFGEGQMLNDENFLMTEMKYMMETRPRLPMNFAEGTIMDYLEGEKQYLCDSMLVIRQLPRYDFTIILKDDCMAPKYETGDELAFKEVKYPQWGKDFLFDTPDGPMFRKLFEEGDDYRCSSYDSRKYPDILIPRSEVTSKYLCVGFLRHS